MLLGFGANLQILKWPNMTEVDKKKGDDPNRNRAATFDSGQPDDLKRKFDFMKTELDTFDGVCELLCSSITNNPAVEPIFLSIQQLLLLIPEELSVRRAYLKLIESCISEIVFHKNGCEPDSDSKFQFQTPVSQLIESLQDEVVSKKLQDAVRQKQEAMLTTQQYWDKLCQFREENAQLRKYISDPIMTPLPAATECNLSEPGKTTTKTVDSTKSTTAKPSNIPPAPPPPPIGVLPKVTVANVPAPPPPPPGLLGGPKIPVPPPPPPPIGLLSSGSGPKIPMPPPPPPGLSFSFKSAAPIRPALPDYLPPKKKQQVDVSMRKPPVASFTIDPKTISESSFWTRTKEDDLLNSEALDQLKAKFALKPAVRSLASSSETELDMTASVKIKVPQIIHDDKTIQRLGIVQGSVKMSYSGLKRAILQMDESKLTKDLEQLRSALPPADVLAKLAEVSKEQYDEMPEGEQFAAYLATISSLPLRLDLIQFHMQYKASVDEIKSMMTTVSEACFELQHSEGFSAFLSIVLGMCNYMSASSKSHKDIYAFEMRMLPKLMDTRDIDGRGTLLHHIAQHMRSTLDAQLCRFAAHDMYHCQLAARINPDELQKLVTLLAANIKKLEKFLSNYKSVGEDDRFEEVMRPFLEETNKEQDTIQIMNKKMSSDWAALAKYFAFDSNKYKMEEFFNDMKTFKQQFEQVCRDLDKEIADAKRRDETQQKRKALADRQEQANRTGNAEREMDRTSPGRSSIHGDKRLSADTSKVSAWDELDSKMLGDASLFGLLSHSRAASRQGLNRVKVAGKHHSIQRQRSRMRSNGDLFGSPSKTISGRIPLRTPNASPSRSLFLRPTSNSLSPPSPSGGPSSSSSTPLRVGIGLPGMSNTEGTTTSPVMRVRRKGAPAVPVEDAHLYQYQRQMTSPSHKENLAPGEREEHEQRQNKQDMETEQTETLGRDAEANRQNEAIAKLPTAEELIERLSRL